MSSPANILYVAWWKVTAWVVGAEASLTQNLPEAWRRTLSDTIQQAFVAGFDLAQDREEVARLLNTLPQAEFEPGTAPCKKCGLKVTLLGGKIAPAPGVPSLCMKADHAGDNIGHSL